MTEERDMYYTKEFNLPKIIITSFLFFFFRTKKNITKKYNPREDLT